MKQIIFKKVCQECGKETIKHIDVIKNKCVTCMIKEQVRK